jgi:hypothetical protein
MTRRMLAAAAALALHTAIFLPQGALAQRPERAVRRDIPLTNMIRQAHAAGTRDSTGAPGANYWQTRVDYRIEARLDAATSRITGRQTATIHNASSEPMRMLVLRLDQNIFAPGALRLTPLPELTEGMEISRLVVNGRPIDLRTPLTVAQIALPEPIPAGGQGTLEVDWSFRVSRTVSRGLRHGAWGDSLVQVAQWYPRVAVYDDLRGWDTDPYLGPSEFYNNFGSFDVRLDVPAGWVVGSTGTLQNPEQVLTPAARERLANALRSDGVTTIVSAEERGPGAATAAGERLVWHFRADSVNDFAWAASSVYVWKVQPVAIPGRGTIPLHVLHTRNRAPAFEQVPAVGRHALEFYSQLWLPYAFPQHTVVDGPEQGMEYPLLIMSGLGALDHEVGHQWWPMMVGVNETWYGFMDEGFNVYMNALSRAHAQGRAPVLDTLGQRYGMTSGSELEAPLMWNANYGGPMYRFQAYQKAPLMLSMLGGIVGDSAVWRAVSEYAHAWRFKHPTPWDFAFFMNHALKQDLGWFWYHWLWSTDAVDQSVQDVASRGTHTVVTVRQDGGMPSPVVLKVQFAGQGPAIRPMKNSMMLDDTTARVTYPVDVWFDGRRTYEADLDFGGRAITRITLDPDGRFPDGTPRDNIWPQPKEVQLTAALLESYVGNYQAPGVGELAVTREASTLWIQPNGQGRMQLLPTSETEFYLKEAPATITFVRDDSGTATGLVIGQGGQQITAAKVKQ